MPTPQPKLSPEEMQILRAFERGRSIREVVNLPGWKHVLDIMEEEVGRAEFHLMNYNGSDKDELLALHRRARDMREFFQETQKQIAVSVQAAESIPTVLGRTATPLEPEF